MHPRIVVEQKVAVWNRRDSHAHGGDQRDAAQRAPGARRFGKIAEAAGRGDQQREARFLSRLRGVGG